MDMKLLKDTYEAKIRASENENEYLKNIVEEQKKALIQKDEIIKQILEIK